jgi:hypothetical protein
MQTYRFVAIVYPMPTTSSSRKPVAPPFGQIRARPFANALIKKIARARDMKHAAVLDALSRGWHMLSDEQRERAFCGSEGGAR